MEPSLTCPYCQAQVTADAIFCLACGQRLRVSALSTTVGKQALMYTVSVLLPPFGLGWAFKYFRQGSETGKKIAWTIVILTIISLIVNIWIIIALYEQYFQLLDQISNPNL